MVVAGAAAEAAGRFGGGGGSGGGGGGFVFFALIVLVFLVISRGLSAVGGRARAQAPARARAAGDAGGRRGGAGRRRLRRRPRQPARPAALFIDIQEAWDGARPPAPARAHRRRPAGRVGAPPGRLRRQGLAQPRARRARARPSSTSASSTARPTRRTAPSCASAAPLDAGSRRPTGSASTRPATTTRDRLRRVLDAGQARRPLDARLHRAGRRGRPPPHRRDRRLAVVRRRLHDEALVEQAVADRVPEGFSPADAASFAFAGSAREEALDLSLADARFLPDVLEAAVRRAAAAWAEAVDGEDAALERVASPEAIDALLYGADAQRRTRLVVRGPRIERVVIERVDAQAQPARMTVTIDVRGRRYREDRDTAAVRRRLARPRGDLRRSAGSWPSTGPTTRRGASSAWRALASHHDHQGRLHRRGVGAARACAAGRRDGDLARRPGRPDRGAQGVHRGDPDRARGRADRQLRRLRPGRRRGLRREGPAPPEPAGRLQAQGQQRGRGDPRRAARRQRGCWSRRRRPRRPSSSASG